MIVILSIDSICERVFIIFINIVSKKKDVVEFITQLKEILECEDFDIDSNFILIKKHKAADEEHSTTYTLLDLEYDIWDVVERIKELTVSEYSETKIDRDDDHPPLLYVFGKYVNNKLVYIKLKIKEDNKKFVLCVSFHYAKESMEFPYKK